MVYIALYDISEIKNIFSRSNELYKCYILPLGLHFLDILKYAIRQKGPTAKLKNYSKCNIPHIIWNTSLWQMQDSGVSTRITKENHENIFDKFRHRQLCCLAHKKFLMYNSSQLIEYCDFKITTISHGLLQEPSCRKTFQFTHS